MTDNIIAIPKGHLRITRWDFGKDPVILVDRPNQVLAGAKEAIAKSVGGSNNGHLNRMGVLKNGIYLATNGINQITYPSSNSVRFVCVFGFNDFDDTLDTAHLIALGGYVFSHATGLAISKNNLQKLAIDWTITFEID